jgi:hypothetical protein
VTPLVLNTTVKQEQTEGMPFLPGYEQAGHTLVAGMFVHHVRKDGVVGRVASVAESQALVSFLDGSGTHWCSCFELVPFNDVVPGMAGGLPMGGPVAGSTFNPAAPIGMDVCSLDPMLGDADLLSNIDMWGTAPMDAADAFGGTADMGEFGCLLNVGLGLFPPSTLEYGVQLPSLGMDVADSAVPSFLDEQFA